MGINFTVSEATENFVVRSLHCITAALQSHCSQFICYGPKHRKMPALKYLLMIMQAFSGLIELHMGVLFAPIPLFPLMGAYCKGILCEVHVPTHISIAILFFIVLGCFIMLNICIFYRHQAIIPENHRLKMGQEHPSMTWLFSKQGWIVWNPEGSVRYVVHHALINHTFQGPLNFFMIRHSLQMLKQRMFDMSSRTIAFHRAMITSLIMQSFCCVFVFVPVTVLVTSIVCESIPHEVTIAAFLVAQLFTPLHSITVILSSATLRKSVLSYIRYRSSTSTPKISIVLPQSFNHH